jgi:hypothetical protein
VNFIFPGRVFLCCFWVKNEKETGPASFELNYKQSRPAGELDGNAARRSRVKERNRGRETGTNGEIEKIERRRTESETWEMGRRRRLRHDLSGRDQGGMGGSSGFRIETEHFVKIEVALAT